MPRLRNRRQAAGGLERGSCPDPCTASRQAVAVTDSNSVEIYPYPLPAQFGLLPIFVKLHNHRPQRRCLKRPEVAAPRFEGPGVCLAGVSARIGDLGGA